MAAAVFAEALHEDPDDPTAWLGMSRTLAAAKDMRGALDRADRAISIDPNYGDAWLERGLLHEGMQNLSEAIRSFGRALELFPGNKAARTHIADLQARGVAAPPSPARAIREDLPRADERSTSGVEAVHEAPREVGRPEVPGVKGLPVVASPAVRPRVRTFADGLDDALGGGIPQGSVVVVEGMPGTMKSSFVASILLHNASESGRRGLYVTLEESAASLASQLRSLGLDPAAGGDRLQFFDMRAMAEALANPDADWLDALERVVAGANGGERLEFVVIDSLDALEVVAKFKGRRRQIYRLFEWLRDLGLTAFVIAERPDVVAGPLIVQGRWDEDFLADGVIQLRLHRISDVEVQRRLRILKMRGARHETAYYALMFDERRFRVTRAMAA